MTIKNQTGEKDNRISLKAKTVNVLLDSAKAEFIRLQENPEVKRALILQETLKNIRPEATEEQAAPRENERGADVNTRIMRSKEEIDKDRVHILKCIEKHSPITISELYKLFRVGEERSDRLYKAMYSDINIHKENGLINKTRSIITIINQPVENN